MMPISPFCTGHSVLLRCMAALEHFDDRKARVLAGLADEAPDNSPKGGLDAPLEELVGWINSQPDWCTTSSCSGRITLYRRASIFPIYLPLLFYYYFCKTIQTMNKKQKTLLS